MDKSIRKFASFEEVKDAEISRVAGVIPTGSARCRRRAFRNHVRRV